MCRIPINAKYCQQFKFKCFGWINLFHTINVYYPNGNQCYAETDYCTGVLLENDESCWLDSVCKSEYCTSNFGVSTISQLQLKFVQNTTTVKINDITSYCSSVMERKQRIGNSVLPTMHKSLNAAVLHMNVLTNWRITNPVYQDDDCITPICNNLSVGVCLKKTYNNMFVCGKEQIDYHVLGTVIAEVNNVITLLHLVVVVHVTHLLIYCKGRFKCRRRWILIILV